MKQLLLFLSLLIAVNSTLGQPGNDTLDIDIFVIDSYVTPEKPHRIKITFFTSTPVYSKLILNNEHELAVSDTLSDNHIFELNLSGYKFDSTTIPYYIIVRDENDRSAKSELYDLALPDDNELLKGKGSSFFTICCFGGIIFGLPSPTYVVAKEKSYFSLSKEIPIVSFYKGGYNYPIAYVSLEYAHIFEAVRKNYLRLGFKYIFQTGFIEYVSPGVNGFTDFKGFNGLAPEISLGLFKIYNVFTVYTKYRYNFNPGEKSEFFHEISIGLYSNFFSINF